MLIFLDHAFYVLHTLLILFNIVGWAWRRTRLLHLLTMVATALSWFALGAFYGWGYCLCTDWHFQVRRQLGYHGPESSYIQLLAGHWFGVALSRPAADLLAGTTFAFIVLATAVVWFLEWRRWRRKRSVAEEVA